jgi:ferrous iron transport protein B
MSFSTPTRTAGDSTTIRHLTVALVGNPNTGKSTLFSALAGIHQRTGNYPGVTVEKKIGRTHIDGRQVDLVDLPGAYSLVPHSPDEMVTVDVLLGRQHDVAPIDCIVSIVDASNLERNLYLVSQVKDLGLPVVVALNMTDIAETRNIRIDAAALQQNLGAAVVLVQANRKRGLAELKSAIAQAVASPVAKPEIRPEPTFLQEMSKEQRTADVVARYSWVSQMLAGVVTRPQQHVVTASDRLDHFLTHRIWGTLMFALAMLLVFSSVFIFADPVMGWVDEGVGAVAAVVGARMPDGALRSLVVDGIIGGVGSVIIFLPQILILFLFIAVLEDCGYMARAAYLMDKLMTRVGLSGKSFIPLLSSYACAVPGIMATRVIENRRDRMTTILIAPLMSCSARLPVYAILIAAFIPGRKYLGGLLSLQGLTLFAMYLVGTFTAALVALILKRTVFRGPTPPFVMELPSYKWPSPQMVLRRMLDRGLAFLQRAGTLILAVSILVWAASYYPHDVQSVEGPWTSEREQLSAAIETSLDEGEREAARERLVEIDHQIAAEYQRQSWLGRSGKWIEPAVRPLGWDWRIGCAVIASFPAREVVMGVLGVIYSLGSDIDVGAEQDQSRLEAKLQSATWDATGEPVYNIPVALGLMVFFALCAQCAATLAVIRRETNSWRWPLFAFVYMTALAYVGALVTYQIGIRLIG